MNPTLAGIATATIVVAIAIAFANLASAWRRRHVRNRLIVQQPAPRTFALPAVHAQFGVVVVIGAGIAGCFGLLADGIGLATLASFAIAFTCVVLRARSRRVRLRTYNRQLLRVLDAVVLSLRSGSGLVGGIREAASAHDGIVEADLCEVVRLLDFGVTFEDALQEWTRLCPLRSVQLTVACITLAYETGGSSARSIGTVRATIRNALSAEASAQTHAAQARASATMLASLPFALSGPMLFFNETARAFMLHSPVGLAILLGGLTLDVLGLWWMSVLIGRAQS